MENKHLTKKVLEENNIKVPVGITLKKKDEIDYELFKNHKMVVKPLDTNFGIGITIFDLNPSKEEIDKAIDFAFDNADTIIIEEFFEGTEFRFLVFGGECVSIVKRIPAHVIGDGKHSVKELVEIKNKNPLRSKGYVTPVELINLGEFEKDFIKQQGKDENTILKENEILYLRKNSNVSTGGDSVELFEQIPKYYKKISEEAARGLGTVICGVDMIIKDIYQPQGDYTIIEANFNPAIQMHTFPYIGYGKEPAKKLLELLDEYKK